MHKISVGKSYPVHNHANGIERPVLQTNTAFFDVLFYSSDPKADQKFWGTGSLNLYPVFISHLPFVCAVFPDQHFSFDVSMNFFRVHEHERAPWLNKNANTISFVLIDASTNIVYSQRFISVDWSDEFRRQCALQLHHYNTEKDITTAINSVLATHTTEDLIKRG